MALNLDVDVGDTVMIGDSSIKVLQKTGRKARLSIDAHEDIDVSMRKASPSIPRGDVGKRKGAGA